MKELKYPSKETMERLTEELKLKGAGRYTQDWECEVANVDQLSDYIKFYRNSELSLNEKSTLMRIILEAYNDYVSFGNEEDLYGEFIKEILESEYYIHKESIAYWSCENENLSDCFAISSFMRTLRK